MIYKGALPNPNAWMIADTHFGPGEPPTKGSMTIHPSLPMNRPSRPLQRGRGVPRLLVWPGWTRKIRQSTKFPDRKDPDRDFGKWLTFPGPDPVLESGKVRDRTDG